MSSAQGLFDGGLNLCGELGRQLEIGIELEE